MKSKAEVDKILLGVIFPQREREHRNLKETMMNKRSFEEWKIAVDLCVVENCGLTSDDLPDWGYYDAWKRGVTPERAARAVIRNARTY